MCANCAKNGETCDYSIRLNWAGRSRKDQDGAPSEAGSFTFVATPTSASHSKSNSNAGQEHVFSAQHIMSNPQRPPSSRPQQPPDSRTHPQQRGPVVGPAPEARTTTASSRLPAASVLIAPVPTSPTLLTCARPLSAHFRACSGRVPLVSST